MHICHLVAVQEPLVSVFCFTRCHNHFCKILIEVPWVSIHLRLPLFESNSYLHQHKKKEDENQQDLNENWEWIAIEILDLDSTSK